MLCSPLCSPTEPVLFLTVFAASLIAYTTEDEVTTRPPTQNSSSELVVSLRRQLMENNYDYISTESEDFPAKHEQEHRRAVSYTTSSQPPPDDGTPTLLPFVNDIYIPRTNTSENTFNDDEMEDRSGDSLNSGDVQSDDEPRNLRKNDLLYYLDDSHLNRRAASARKVQRRHKDKTVVKQQDTDVQPEYKEDTVGVTTPKVKYKVLKMKEPVIGSRRAGVSKDGYRRFLQVEGEDGVSIINLGDEPFPEFRLPSARRQHMTGNEALKNDLEIAIPSDLEDPITRPA